MAASLRKLLHSGAWLMALACASLAQAQPAARSGLPAGNSEQPINLEAASSDFDYKNNALLFRRVRITQGGLEVTAHEARATGLEFENSEWSLLGDVKITVPGGLLQSSEARVQFRNNEIVLASIKGAPAAFEQRLKDKEQVARGRAAAIVYNVKESTVRLTGNAWLSDGQNEIQGNTLVYDIGRERVQANPDEKTRAACASPSTRRRRTHRARRASVHEPAARRGTRQELPFPPGGP